MKNSIRVSLAAMVLVALTLSSCGKYDEGPAISLRSKKARISNTWMVEKYMENGVDQTQAFNSSIANYQMTMDKDGSYTVSGTVAGFPFSDAGTWELLDDKVTLQTLSNQSGSTPDKTTIIRLKEKELWTKYTDSGGTVIETHYAPK